VLSKRVIVPMPERPARAAFQPSAAVKPSGETIPIPVITTRFEVIGQLY
jgi:hypothetical protein